MFLHLYIWFFFVFVFGFWCFDRAQLSDPDYRELCQGSVCVCGNQHRQGSFYPDFLAELSRQETTVLLLTYQHLFNGHCLVQHLYLPIQNRLRKSIPLIPYFSSATRIWLFLKKNLVRWARSWAAPAPWWMKPKNSRTTQSCSCVTAGFTWKAQWSLIRNSSFISMTRIAKRSRLRSMILKLWWVIGIYNKFLFYYIVN